MLGRRRRELRRARSCGSRRRARAPLARPPGPLCAARAAVRGEGGRPDRDSGTGMHSARLDSFLGQLRWELLCGRDTGSPQMPGSLKPSPKPGQGVQPSHRLRASDASEEDSACCVEEEDEEEVMMTGDRGAALRGPREHTLDWDSGFSEVSGSTWQEEELPVLQRPTPPARPPDSQRLSANGLPLPSRASLASAPPAHRPRPKSTPDACLEHWQGLDAEDWTAALLSRGRSRQPLVLGDNCFADLVHNWMELPETASEGGSGGGGGPRARTRPPQFLLGLSEQLRRRLAGARRAAMAGKRLSCPPRPEPELPADVSRFAALMSCRSRQPIICNDVISYL
ncbi:PAK4-inhibitor INKA1 isoform X1 [Elephas maximus indicus]|uniref:PAK4-inhibitor INKA1 isoform X1 n=1 Tax=Elephas maximus indicus TaxID=99487 RepID=UPI002116D9D0|nr:PAK4-inhibitor INKA1 isoform X1 [Elephas maximus indicus]